MDKTMNDKLTYILNDDKQNYPFSFSRLKLLVKRLEFTSLEATNVKVPKVFKPTIKISWSLYFGYLPSLPVYN